ncbi:hypothetical protein BGZ80_004216 [Entomortierella chlamydospora]|uniref:EF-hand domain-containing protein n=1 Tax=Entomortierella chlamydospora TaxID=101097 RepID=A0A9P6MMC2_9FUNG|nr:hypothetical protein BGZ79_007831 [Entomortierella chlamydospora]KAG0007796.1 hypothetical protein BGZ80_004216 [Entomortierella chlamydospora]
MPTAVDPGPTKEESKDRTSIKLMDLPMQPKKKKSENKDSTKQSDPESSDTGDDALSKKTGPVTTLAAPASSTTALSQSSIPKQNPDSPTPSGHSNNTKSNSTGDHSKQDSFVHHQQLLDQLHQKEEKEEREERDQRKYKVTYPHFETREERQIRIRKQFDQLDAKRSGVVDANSLVVFFADITPDKDVQRRYADELLQLCHSKILTRSNHGGEDGGEHSDHTGSDLTEHEDGQESQQSQHPHQHRRNHSHPRQHNGHVNYDDFEVFVEEKEERLWNLFREIDHNNDNEIQPEELQASLAKLGINMSEADLHRFFKAMDKDDNGAIDFEEWRDFLVLLPRETTLKEIYHYVQEVVAQVGVDGDVVMPPSENDYVARYLLAGAIAGAVSRTATAPLDRLKVYLITKSVPALTGPAAEAGLKHIPKLSGSSAVAPVKQRLLWTSITELYNQGGFKTFFRGNGLNIIKIAPESAIKFYTYETSKAFIVSHLPSFTVQHHYHDGSGVNQHPPDIATSGRFLAGGVAGLVSQFSIYPLETIKTRIMSSTGGSQQGQAITSTAKSPVSISASASGSASTSSSTSSLLATQTSTSTKPCRLNMQTVIREIWQKAGLRGFYRGLGPSLVGIFPYAAIDLSVFETLKFGYMRWKAGVHEGDKGSEEKALDRPSVFVLLACGTISGSVGATSVYPLSLVRTRLQAQGTPHHPQTYTSTLDVFRKTYAKEGVRGFYKGMVPTLTKVVPAVSISYVVYEYSKRELGL